MKRTRTRYPSWPAGVPSQAQVPPAAFRLPRYWLDGCECRGCRFIRRGLKKSDQTRQPE